LLIHINTNTGFGNKEEIKLLTFTYDNMDLYNKERMEKEFGEYAENNNLNITVTLEIIRYEKPSDSYSYFKTLVETLLKKSNSPYDIYIYESIHTSIYGSYLLNLNDYLPKEHIEMYNSKLIKEEFINEKDELVGLVMLNDIKFINNYDYNWKIKKKKKKRWKY